MAVVCGWCGEPVVIVNEHRRCERRVEEADGLAGELQMVELQVAQWLESGRLSVGQLQVAFQMIVSDAFGELAGAGVWREPVTSRDRGVWAVWPPSVLETRREGMPDTAGALETLPPPSRVAVRLSGSGWVR